MTTPAKSRPVVVVTLVGCALAVCGWQFMEHRHIEQAAAAALINRGRDITYTFGVVVRSQRRFGTVISKERTEAAMQDLIHPGEVESIAILGATGEPIASAGRSFDLTSDVMHDHPVYWRNHTLILLNPMDLGSNQSEDGAHAHPQLVVVDEQMRSQFRGRRPDAAPGAPGSESTSASSTPPPSGSPASPTLSPEPNPPASTAPATPSASAPNAAPANGSAVSIVDRPPDGQSPRPARRTAFGRPSWMTPAEYEALIQKQGVHTLMVALSTDEMRHIVRSDLLLRAMVCALSIGAAVMSALALRNLGKTADLQIRLIKAGEMNTHLKEMNLAAAGLAHETRNPLNLIRGFAQMIAIQEASSAQLKNQAHTIMEEADRVTAQLNEFINYSKPREVQLSVVDVSRVATDVARTLLSDTEEKRVRIQVSETPRLIEADEQLLRQALFNLVLNAVQAVDLGGQIEIAVLPTGNEVVIEIRDDGPGVPSAQREAIFKPYVTMRPKGVGLGLAIVQQIISAHRWEISCEANQPRGALFRIRRVKVANRQG